jgi:hypothetical protein
LAIDLDFDKQDSKMEHSFTIKVDTKIKEPFQVDIEAKHPFILRVDIFVDL